MAHGKNYATMFYICKTLWRKKRGLFVPDTVYDALMTASRDVIRHVGLAARCK